MKLTKSRTLTGLILAVLMALPLATILSRVIYVQSNKNAYQSYSNKIEIINEYETNDVESLNDLVVGRAYTYTYDSTITTQTRLGIEKILLNEDLNHYDFEEISLQYDTTIRTNYTFNGTTYNSFTITPLNTSQNGYTTLDSIDFIYGNTNFNQNADVIIACISKCNNLPIQSINNEDGTLDNVFEYSVSQFIEDNNFGKVDLTSWFTGMFLSENAHNNLYVHFANWYLNYVMLITLMHFLFAVLMWFINYCRRLLDRGMNYDW